MRIWILAAFLLVFATVGLAMFPRMMDWNTYRQDLEVAASKHSGHDVTISGPIEVTLLPQPMLMAKDVTVANHDSETLNFGLVANQANVSFKIGPLLVGKPVVKTLYLKRPTLSLTGGSWQRLTSWPPRWRDWAAPLSKLDLEGISIANGRISIDNEARSQSSSIRDLSLDIRIDKPANSVEAVGLFKTKRHSFTISSEFGRPDANGARAAKLLVEAQNGQEEQTSLRFGGRLSLVDDVPNLRGRMSLGGPDLQHGLAALAAATGYPSTFRFLKEAQPFAIEGQIEADREGVRANDMQLRLAEKIGKGAIDLQLHPQHRLNLSLELPTLRLAEETGLVDFLPLDVLSKLEVPPGEIDIRLREVAYRNGSARQASLKLHTSRDGVTTVEEAKTQLPGLIDIRFEGGLYPAEIGSQLRGKLAAVGDNLKSSLNWIGLMKDHDSTEGWRNFSLTGDLNVSSVEVALTNTELSLDSSSAVGRANLRFSERQRLNLDVEFDRPNVDLYLSAYTPRQVLAALSRHLSAVDVDANLRFKRLIWQGFYLENGTLRSRAENGQIFVDEIQINTVGDTTLSLAGTIDIDDRSADLQTQISSQQPFRTLRHIDVDLPINASRLRPVEFSGAIKGSLDLFEAEFDAIYDGGNAHVEAEAGWLDDRLWYNLAAEASHPDNQALARQFGLAPVIPDGDADGPLELAGRIRHAAGTPWVASGSWTLGPTTFTGSLSFEDAPFKSPFDAKLSVGVPQKDSLAPFLILMGLKLTNDWTPARWLGRLPDIGLRSAWLESTEGTLSLSSKGGIVGDSLAVEAALKDGLLYIKRVDARPWNGRLQAEMTLERRREQPFLAVAISLDQVSSAEFAEWIGAKSGLDGPLDLRFEASSVGFTAYDLIASLSGTIEAELGPGELRGVGIPALKRSLFDRSADEGSPIDRSLTLPFNGIDATAAINRGIFTIETGKLSVSSEADGEASADLTGGLDLLLWIVDLTVTTDDRGIRDDPHQPPAYHVIGPPNRPFGMIKDGN